MAHDIERFCTISTTITIHGKPNWTMFKPGPQLDVRQTK